MNCSGNREPGERRRIYLHELKEYGWEEESVHLGHWGVERSKEGKRKLSTVPIGRVCSSVRYRRQCQHTRCAQYSYCHTARHTSLSFPAWHLHLHEHPSCLAHVLPPLIWTGYILPFPPLSVLPHGPVHQCHVPRAKLTDLPSFALSPLSLLLALCIYYRLDTLPDIGLI